MGANIRLRVLRAERGLSQMDTAAKAGLTTNRYWMIENGYRQANERERKALARALDVGESEAFPIETQERAS